MPSEHVDLGEPFGEQEVYLIETRSISGLSGSPVFLYTPPFRIVNDEVVPMQGHARDYLMGVNIGMFETKANADKLRNEPDPEEKTLLRRASFLESISAGISVVIPVQRIIEIVRDYPNFVQGRAMSKIERNKKAGFKPTSVASAQSSVASPTIDANPTHREDFTSLKAMQSK